MWKLKQYKIIFFKNIKLKVNAIEDVLSFGCYQ